MATVTMGRYPLPLKFFRLHEGATLPTVGSKDAMCFDLYACLDGVSEVKVHRGEVTMVGTGWQFQIPEGFGVEIHSRSGYSTKYGLQLANTVGQIDRDYNGEVMMALTLVHRTNFHGPLTLHHGQRVAQAKLVPAYLMDLRETQFAAAATARGAGGFGSSGV